MSLDLDALVSSLNGTPFAAEVSPPSENVDLGSFGSPRRPSDGHMPSPGPNPSRQPGDPAPSRD